MPVVHCSDFKLTGDGNESAWRSAQWTAEFYIPYALLKPVISGPPVKGSRWRANFYRIDYDHGQSEWSWLPVPGTFHD